MRGCGHMQLSDKSTPDLADPVTWGAWWSLVTTGRGAEASALLGGLPVALPAVPEQGQRPRSFRAGE